MAGPLKLGTGGLDETRLRLRWDDPTVAMIELVDEQNTNALSRPLVGALMSALASVAVQEECCAVILTGCGDWFSSGAPPALLEDLKANRLTPEELGLSEVLMRLPVVTIAALQGNAIGGGLALAMACDMVLASDTARYGFNFMHHGITPGMAVTRIAEDFLGRPLAHRLLYSGDLIRGADLPPHLVEVAPANEVLDRAIARAYSVADKPKRNLAMLKRSLIAPRLRAFEEAKLIEGLMHETSIGSLEIDGLVAK